MAIQASSVTANVIRVKSPSGTYYNVDSVSFTAANGQAVFRVSRTWTSADNGQHEVYTAVDDKVIDGAGNFVPTGVKLGSFTVNITTPAGDTTPPTATWIGVTPTSITTAGNQEVVITVEFKDA